ncbi:MAG TPA: hypothetical protein VFZ36_10620 [Vicinamibacterales bacterium]
MRALAAALLLAVAPGFAVAQQPPPAVPAPPPEAEPVIRNRPVSGFVVDARGVLAKFGQRPLTATALGVTAADLPGPGLGGSVGAHVYLLRLGRVAVGAGGEVLLARRSRQPIDTAGEPAGPSLQTRLFSIAPQVSLNFGNRNGWSYVSAGMGSATFETWSEPDAMPDRRVRAINYGGGARWFRSPHLAFTVDLRFYAISPGLAIETGADLVAERPRQRLMVISAGVSVR